MKLVKSLLLGSAAGLAAVAGAQAADLPVRKAAPVEYVRVCSAYGVGFFYIPGTDTCLRVSGRARFEYNVASARQFSQSPTGFRSTGRINLDARTQTAYGTLRAFVRYEIARRTGQFHSGTAIRQGNAEPAIGFDASGRPRQGVHPVRRHHRRSGDVVLRLLCQRPRLVRHRRRLGPGLDEPPGLHGLVRLRLVGDPVARRSGRAPLSGRDQPRRRNTRQRRGAVRGGGSGGPDLQPDHWAADQQRLRRSAAAQRDARHRRGGSGRSALGFGTAVWYNPPDLYDWRHHPGRHIFSGATFTGFRPDTEYGYGVQA